MNMFNINNETLNNLTNKVIETKLKIKSDIFNYRNTLVEGMIKELGFHNVTVKGSPVESYVRYNDEFKYTHVVELCHKKSGKHILQSYAKEVLARNDNGVPIGNCGVGLTYTELMAFTLKMKLLGLES